MLIERVELAWLQAHYFDVREASVNDKRSVAHAALGVRDRAHRRYPLRPQDARRCPRDIICLRAALQGRDTPGTVIARRTRSTFLEATDVPFAIPSKEKFMIKIPIAEACALVAPTINPFHAPPERIEVRLTLEDLVRRHPRMVARLHVPAERVTEVAFSVTDGIADLTGH